MLIRIIRPAISIGLLIAGVGLVSYSYGFDSILAGIGKLSPLTIGVVVAGLLANSVAAAFRFKIIAAQTGHPVRFRQAMAAVGTSSLAGAMFFQLAGQLMARGFIMRRANMPFAAVVAVTLYERIVAALLSALLALAGAIYIFGNVYLDKNEGGYAFIKIVCGLIAAVIGGALLGYGRDATRAIAPYITRHFASACLRIFALTLLVQIPMMIAYVAAAHAVSPQVAIAELVAASSIVMFAASIPISLAGWGVREMSAIVALGTIGVAANDALTVAILIGAGSLLSMAVISMAGWSRSVKKPVAVSELEKPVDYAQGLAWGLPITAAVFVLFQVYVPVRSGLINVNLADPVVMLGGSLFVIEAIRQARLPYWRVKYLNLAVAATTAALGCSLLLGAYRFGWTDWAVMNRFFGWFILLAFAATGALIVNAGGLKGFRIVVLTYAGATAAVALLELTLLLIHSLGIRLPPALLRPGDILAFSQNHNFFAFQLLMATAAALVMVRGRSLRIFITTVMLTALFFAGSRSGWIAIACLVAAGLYLRTVAVRELAVSIVGAACVIAVLVILPIGEFLPAIISRLFWGWGLGEGAIKTMPMFVPTGLSTTERMTTIIGGWNMFISHPIFGAGLGAFRNENILATSGIPLVIHSTALWLLAELGVVGFLIFAVPGAYVWAAEWLRAREEPASAVIVLCLVGFAIMSGPADMVYQRTFWLLMGAALALPRRHTKRA